MQGVKELINVKHMQELNKAGCINRVESSVLKVIKGSTVKMKGDMANGLYVL